MGLGISQYFGASFYKGLESVASFFREGSELISDVLVSCCNSCRKLSKEIVNAKVLDLDLDEEVTKTKAHALEAAKSRNGAKDNEALAKYHETIEYSKTKAQGIFQYHEASHNKDRKLVILLMGNLQGHGDSEEEVGLLKIYKELKKEDQHDVLLCRVGSCLSDIKNILGLSKDMRLDSDLVYEHISNLIDDRCHCKGKFASSKKPTSIDCVGYSWGGGVQKKLEQRWQKISNGIDEVHTACIDGIEYGCTKLGDELTTKPNYSTKHLNIFQNNSFLLNGEKNIDHEAGDCFIDVDTIDSSEPGHRAIDDSEPVLNKLRSFLADKKKP